MSLAGVGRPGWVGKVPWGPEFLPVPTHAQSFASFDSWLTLACDWAAAAVGPTWSVAFERGAIHGFVFHDPREPAERVLCGALAPSRDSAGRQFPVALGVPLVMPPAMLARPELTPLTLEEHWARATSAVIDALHDPAAMGRWNQVSAGESADVAGAAELYDGWAGELPLVEWWELLGPAVCDPAATFRYLLEAIAPFRGAEPVRTSLCLRLPLGRAGGVALCFWLDVVRRCSGWRRTLPSLLWSHDGQAGTALLALGRLSPASLAEIWSPTGARDDIADLTRPLDLQAVQALAPLPAPLADALALPQQPVARLLDALRY